MKTLRKIGIVLIAIVLCAGVTACRNDDETSTQTTIWMANDLIGTIWKGKNPSHYFNYKLTVKDATKCQLSITTPTGNLYEDRELPYTYNETTGQFTAQYPGEVIIGNISGNTMTFTTQGVKVTLEKQ